MPSEEIFSLESPILLLLLLLLLITYLLLLLLLLSNKIERAQKLRLWEIGKNTAVEQREDLLLSRISELESMQTF